MSRALPADDVTVEAATWVARLSSADASEADQRAFEQWRQADPAHASAYAELDSLWSELRAIPRDRLRRPQSRRGVMLGIAALGAGGVTSFLFREAITDRLQADVFTAVGEMRSMRLPDNSLASLDTNTAIALRFDATERRVRLLHGQCFFQVVQEQARPFLAWGPQLRARTFAADFALSSGVGGVPPRVLVERGEVEVSDGTNRLLLLAGEEACLRAGQLQRSAGDIGAETAWRHGQMVFSGEPLGQVLRQLNRYRRDRILVLDREAAERRISGIFDLRDTDQALATIARTQPVTIQHLAGLVTLVRNRG